VNKIRPWQMFSKLADQHINMIIPKEPSAVSHSVMALETQLLVTAARLCGARKILEIGTGMGYTSLHLAANTLAEITTFDIEEREIVFPIKGKVHIERLVGPPKTLTPKPYDMVFIDGDHSYKGVDWDTRLAFECNPRVIAWHDFRNPSEPTVAEYIMDCVDPFEDLYHVEDSWLVFWFKGGI
jgi:hypothetical protein